MLKSLVLLAGSASTGLATLLKYDWDITWVNAAPDGFSRPVIGINNQWPNPTIEGTVGDIVVINVHNKLGNESTSIHWHGIHQINTNHQDGPAGVTQCPIPPGSTFTYKFLLDQAGTYWYHSHTGTQYPDGLRGALIVHDLMPHYQYDEEYVVSVSDWYHDEVPTLLPIMLSAANTLERPPLPKSGLINDGAGSSLKFEAGKKYRLRIINMSAFTGAFVFFEDHDFTVIEIDGVNVVGAEASQIFLSPAQRYSIIVEAKSDATKNYAFSAVFDQNPNFHHPVVPWLINATGTLEYDSSFPSPAPVTTDVIAPLDDFTLKPYMNPGYGAPGETIQMDFTLGKDAGGIPRAFVNGKTYVHQKVPTLYTVLSVGDDATNPVVYGEVNPFVVEGGEKIVQIVVNNLHFANHPFHLHGHHFQVCSRPAGNTGPSDGSGVECADDAMMRDVILINTNSSAVIRFKTDNPGVWLFHCHIEWHVPMGLVATIIENPEEIQKTISIPEQHFKNCIDGCLPYKGNAGGNTANHTDLSEANNAPPATETGAVFDSKTCHPSEGPSSVYPSSTVAYPSGSAVSSAEWTTSTLYSTTTYTVTSCAPTVTNCPAHGYVTTEVVPWTTTVCPVTAKEAVPTWTGTYDYSAAETAAYTNVLPHSDFWPAPTTTPVVYGTGKAYPTTTGYPVTAAAGKAVSSFGAAAFAAVLAAAALL